MLASGTLEETLDRRYQWSHKNIIPELAHGLIKSNVRTKLYSNSEDSKVKLLPAHP
jgi:hypothetical protein